MCWVSELYFGVEPSLSTQDEARHTELLYEPRERSQWRPAKRKRERGPGLRASGEAENCFGKNGH